MPRIILSDSEFMPTAIKVGKLLNLPVSKIGINHFKNRETRVILSTDVKKQTVILFKALYPEPNDKLFELFLVNDALKQNGARKIINVLPFIPYLRQDRFFANEPVSSKLLSRLLKVSGVKKVITIDLHSKANKKHFRPIEISSGDIFADHLEGKKNSVLVAPDHGAKAKVSKLAKRLGMPCVTCTKNRVEAGKVDSITFDKEIELEGKNVFIYDDMVDTGGTLYRMTELLKPYKPKSITILTTHAIISNPAIAKKLKIITANTIPRKIPNTKVLDIAPYIAREL